MKTFLVANPKGGSGKSTLATHLAAYFAHAGQQVMLGDIDRQHSAREWLASRPAHLPAIATWDIGHDHIARPPRGASHVVLDTPAGLRGKMLDKVLKLSARVIVPVQPSVFDMRATRVFLDALLAEKAVRKGRADVAVIGMRVDPRTRAAAARLRATPSATCWAERSALAATSSMVVESSSMLLAMRCAASAWWAGRWRTRRPRSARPTSRRR